jgi:hypothetical protein
VARTSAKSESSEYDRKLILYSLCFADCRSVPVRAPHTVRGPGHEGVSSTPALLSPPLVLLCFPLFSLVPPRNAVLLPSSCLCFASLSFESLSLLVSERRCGLSLTLIRVVNLRIGLLTLFRDFNPPQRLNPCCGHPKGYASHIRGFLSCKTIR